MAALTRAGSLPSTIREIDADLQAKRAWLPEVLSSYCQYAQMVAELGADGNKTVRG
ncbi:MAG: hypothetical protein GQ526_04175 [Ardenticatenales bacterium]|nr:hypothetical protein [Ardenticatenales bacterium]